MLRIMIIFIFCYSLYAQPDHMKENKKNCFLLSSGIPLQAQIQKNCSDMSEPLSRYGHQDRYLVYKHLYEQNIKKHNKKFKNQRFIKNSDYSNNDSVKLAWIQYHASGLVPGADNNTPSAIKSDSFGNIYVVGASGSIFEHNYVTIKYDTSGVQLWAVQYNGPGAGEDIATALALDSQGNIYVTGYSYGQGTYFDYATIKYNSEGIEQWIARYNGPSNSNDHAIAIAVDIEGNVYVTGYSNNGSNNNDIVTLKYNCNGILQWIINYNGDNNGEDFATGMVIDGEKNLYISGHTQSAMSNFDYVTIKYNCNGNRLWVQYFNGFGNDEDCTSAITIDKYANIYVTGRSYNSETGYDYSTIKYDSAGNQKWIARYDGPVSNDDEASSIFVDDFGNVVVSGRSISVETRYNYDYATIKYDSNGVQQWAARYNGIGYDDFGTCVHTDRSGNVYVSGWSEYSFNGSLSCFTTIKYNYNGSLQWKKMYPPGVWQSSGATAMTTDINGNIYVTGWSLRERDKYDIATIKYNPLGDSLHLNRYNAIGRSKDYVNAIAADKNGNVYVTGESNSLDTRWDILTVKYGSNGLKEWAVRYNSNMNRDDFGRAIVIDQVGNIYVAGISNNDYIIVKYNPIGEILWTSSYNGPGNDTDVPTAMTIDKTDNIYVTGFSNGSNIAFDYATVKYNSSGEMLWAARYDGPGNWDDVPTSITCDELGNVYVTGYTTGGSSCSGILTIKYNTNGIEQWIARYDGMYSYNVAYSIGVDESSNVYVTGASMGDGTLSDYITIKYDSDGNLKWEGRYNGPANSYDVATSLALDCTADRNCIYVTGLSVGLGTHFDYCTIKYDNSGNIIWITRYDGPANNYDEATCIKVDTCGNIYITGGSVGMSGYLDFTSIKYDTSGNQRWINRYSDHGIFDNIAIGIVSDNKNNIYVTGRAERNDGIVFCTIKYEQPSTSNVISLEKPSTEYYLYQNYPNPFNPVTMINYYMPVSQSGLPINSKITLKVYNVMGKEVATLVDEYKEAGYHSAKFDGSKLASGIYFYKIQTGYFVETKKMILVK